MSARKTRREHAEGSAIQERHSSQRTRGLRHDNWGKLTIAGPVTIRHSDGSVEVKPPLTRSQLDKLTPVLITFEVRQSVMLRDRAVCRYCGAPAEELDHVVPRSQGGPTVYDNLVACCRQCNSRKGAQTWQPNPLRG